MQVESIALSRDVPVIFAWFVSPLIRRVSRQTLANLLYATRRALQNPDARSVSGSVSLALGSLFPLKLSMRTTPGG
jgi:hypothetical protein